VSDLPPESEPWPELAALPAADPKQKSPRGRSAPRNYLAQGEKRRIFWLFMPPALVAMLVLGWVERSWFASPPAAVRPQVDTAVSEIPTAPDLADAVVIAAEQELPPGEADEYGASLYSLTQVRDDTMFRGSEDEAWFQIWMTLRSTDMRALARSSARRVSFTELFGQPRSYRGRLVRFRGTLHRLEKVTAPVNQYGVEDYWQGWLEPEGGPVSPIVVYFLRLPEGMPHGMKIGEQVDVVGYFFKRWAYAATDTVRIAPLVLALEPIWKQRPAAVPGGTSIGTVALVTIAAVVLLTMLGIRVAGGGPARRQAAPPTDLSTNLAGVELFSPDEALRRMASEEAKRTPDETAVKESMP
jgi:hypothetical protein